eukprot:12365364-Heterocapsa_arctica.AAC.1
MMWCFWIWRSSPGRQYRSKCAIIARAAMRAMRPRAGKPRVASTYAMTRAHSQGMGSRTRSGHALPQPRRAQ